MRKACVMLLLSCFVAISYSQELDIIRHNYSQAARNKALCKEMISKLENNKQPVQLAYLGAFQTIWAKHALNPFEKMRTFKQGKANIEESIAQSPADLEIRFIRLSVQMNAPKFLGYSDNIEEDKKMIRHNGSAIKSEMLQKMINECIKLKE
ncbi:MAG: hypothetical protein DI539_18450 [Flavobacterium psychrophilum]|nr:MAG: hypothetical protein DI539_18450 [Flavobacterium psychrophilum]